MPSMPPILTAWRTSTASNQPQRRLRPVTTPNSRPRSPSVCADLVGELGRERAAADPRRVGLGDAEHKADRRRRRCPTRPRPARRPCSTRSRRDRCRDRHRASRPARPRTGCAAGAARLVEHAPDRAGIGQHLRRDLAQRARAARRGRPRARRARAAARCGAAAARRRVFERRRVGEIADPDRAAPDLVLIGRADAAAGGADAFARRAAPRARGRARRATAGSARHCRRASGSAA